ncbi:MAG: 4Fe-4S dicluster domain-containing protein [Pirellulales bacterium]|nr:4Fe-4S dicluster domain-containing protein [Pirellulales bacterium]
MSTTVDPGLHKEIGCFGCDDITQCINCGNCTAVCSLSGEDAVFPRKTIRYAQLGIKDRLMESVEPWLCYYCGECSETCPRQANPGEIMMTLRRWLTAQYDWTGLSKKLYLSKTWEVFALAALAAFVVALFVFFHGPMVTDRVELNTFAPVVWVEIGDWVMALLLSSFLFTNVLRMHRYVMGSWLPSRIPFSIYLRELKTLVLHAMTQKRWKDCDNLSRWIKHLLLVTGYVTMLLLIVVFLRWFQTDGSQWRPIDLLGYYATGVLMFVTGEMIVSRLRRREEIHKHSHSTDWIFLVLLFLTALTGILVHGLRLAGLPLPTYYMYVLHLAIAVPMLVIEVPFGKWSHLAYRPLAIYLTNVKKQFEHSSQTANAAMPTVASPNY